MKIHSKFKDYYDSAIAEYDPTFYYVREALEVEDKEVKAMKFPHQHSYLKNGCVGDSYVFAFIFFCGKIYCGVNLNHCWSFGEKAREVYGRPKYDFFNRSSEFFDFHGKECHKVNRRHESPIVSYTSERFWNNITNKWQDFGVWKNCRLDNYHFFKAVDSFQARQMIETYLRNDLAKQVDPQPLSDKSRILAAGFDLKTSFRKDTPPTRKLK